MQHMSVFARVVSAGSFSAAARDLGVSTAVVSRRVAALEARLGIRLLHRTTRRIALTDEGATFHESVLRILREVEEAEAAASAGSAQPRGVLKVAMPASFGHRHIAPLIPVFAQRYPEVELALQLSDRPVAIVEEGFDLGIRIAELADSSLAARKLAPNRRVVCASPAYLERHGAPRTPAELTRHNCLIPNWEHDFSMSWDYREPSGKSGSVRVRGRYACDNWEVLRDWALAGLGIALKSTWDVRSQLEDGSLVPVLPGYTFGTEVA
ncbi:MAG: LysR family transcriptional regulator, partial [Burkholderiales bacterium]